MRIPLINVNLDELDDPVERAVIGFLYIFVLWTIVLTGVWTLIELVEKVL